MRKDADTSCTKPITFVAITNNGVWTMSVIVTYAVSLAMIRMPAWATSISGKAIAPAIVRDKRRAFPHTTIVPAICCIKTPFTIRIRQRLSTFRRLGKALPFDASFILSAVRVVSALLACTIYTEFTLCAGIATIAAILDVVF